MSVIFCYRKGKIKGKNHSGRIKQTANELVLVILAYELIQLFEQNMVIGLVHNQLKIVINSDYALEK